MDSNASAPKLITVGRAAEIAGISRTTAYCSCRAGAMPGSVEINGRWWVRRAVLERWLEGLDGGEPAPPNGRVAHEPAAPVR